MGEVISLDEAVKVTAGKVVVFTNGVFDLLHVGHISYLQKAKTLGDILIVGLNGDASVRALKGKKRPIVPQDERAQVLAALSCMDYVIIFEETMANKLVEALKPDIYVKGGDWDTTSEAEIVTGYGGQVYFLPYKPGYSTTRLIEIIRGQRNSSARLNFKRDLLDGQKRRDLIEAMLVVILSILYIPWGLIGGRFNQFRNRERKEN